MRWRQARSAGRGFALLGFAVLTVACFEHVLDFTAPPSDHEPIVRPAPFDARIAFASTRDGAPYIYLAPDDGSVVHRFIRGERPAWSPDGKRLAFQARTGGALDSAEIRVINLDGSGLRTLPKGGIHPSWSPDGKKIVFTTVVGGADPGIYTVNADGTGLDMLLRTDFEDPGAGDWLGWPAWSPDGTTVAFVRTNYYKQWQIYLVNADGSSPRPLTTLLADQDPSWSPDGSMVAFGSFQRVGTINADGTGYEVYPPANAFDPDWSPDGRSLIFSAFSSSVPDDDSWLGSRMRIYILERESGIVRQLVPEAVAPVLPTYRDEAAVWVRPSRGAGE